MADIYELKPGGKGVRASGGTDDRGTEEANETLLETLSHDLRTPLNSIIGFADMMEQEMLGPISNPQYRDYVQVISRAGRSMLDLINDLLDRKRFENMRRTERSFRQVIELAPDLICIYRDGIIELINPAGADMLGVWPAQNLHGKDLIEFIHPDYRTLFSDGMESLVRERLRVPMRLIKADGSEVDVELAALQYREEGTPDEESEGSDALMIIARDVTERNRAIKAVATREEHLRKIMDTVADGIITIDERGVIETLNPAAEDIFGYTTGEIVGQNVSLLMPDDEALSHDDHIERYVETGTKRIIGITRELTARRKDGSPVPIELAVSEMRFSGRRLFIGAVRDITERKQNEKRLRDLATRDPLTRLPNRNLFTERLEQAIRDADRTEGSFAVLFVDLDNFKTINDALGHVTGDRVIQLAGQRLCNCVRSNDTVAHLSGDEFMVILEDMEDERRAAQIADEMLQNLSVPFKVDGREVFTSGSIGVVLYPQNAKSLVELMRNVDTATHYAKRQGRANFQFYTEKLSSDAHRRMEIESGLRRALENEELELHYQPKMDLEHRRIVGVEALLRWTSPTMGRVRPDHFVPVAEDSGFIIPIGNWVLNQACKQAAQWRADGLPGMHVGVNLSALQFVQGNLEEVIENTLTDTNLPPECLDLELTESMLVENPDETIRLLERFKDMGISISMDDFGTGYSSLSYLTRFPLDALKVDRSFVTHLPDDRDAVAVARAIISMAQNLGLNIVAEGVETEGQVGFLHALGCHVGQGYLFSPPVASDDVAALVEQLNGQLAAGR